MRKGKDNSCLQRVEVAGGAQCGDQRVVRVIVARLIVHLCINADAYDVSHNNVVSTEYLYMSRWRMIAPMARDEMDA